MGGSFEPIDSSYSSPNVGENNFYERILEILNEFEAVSGLQINIKKTQLMITGGDDERIGDIIEGIKTVDSIEVLGVKIDRKLQKLDEN